MRNSEFKVLDENMYIGKLATLTGATPKAIRHYEKLGLLPVAKRQGKYRIYEDIDIQAVKMIRLAQSVGFSLAELYDLSVIKYERKTFPLDIAKTLIEKKQQQILENRKQLDLLEKNLKLLKQEIIDTYN